MANIGLVSLTVDVQAGHVYAIGVDGAAGPINVHDGNSLDAPIICRLRDNKRGYFWEPSEDGQHELMVAGWPSQPGKTRVVVRDIGAYSPNISNVVAAAF